MREAKRHFGAAGVPGSRVKPYARSEWSERKTGLKWATLHSPCLKKPSWKTSETHVFWAAFTSCQRFVATTNQTTPPHQPTKTHKLHYTNLCFANWPPLATSNQHKLANYHTVSSTLFYFLYCFPLYIYILCKRSLFMKLYTCTCMYPWNCYISTNCRKSVYLPYISKTRKRVVCKSIGDFSLKSINKDPQSIISIVEMRAVYNYRVETHI